MCPRVNSPALFVSWVEIVGMVGILIAKIGLYISCSFKDLLLFVCMSVSVDVDVLFSLGQKRASDALKL